MNLAFSGIAAMFGSGKHPMLDPKSLFYLREYAFFLLAGVLFAFPLLPFLRRRFPSVYHVLYSALLMVGTILSISALLRDAYNPFLYFQF